MICWTTKRWKYLTKPNIQVYNCAWFGNVMFFNQDPDRLQQNFLLSDKSKEPWFAMNGTYNYEFIVMPWSVHNKHFVVCVVDFVHKVIIFCDSQGGSYPTAVRQCFRYLCRQHFINTGRKVNCMEWSHCYYVTVDKDFPRQIDSNNCGPYVCMMVKCILLERKLHYKHVTDLRRTIYKELTSNTLLL